jgi:hypothetical protein
MILTKCPAMGWTVAVRRTSLVATTLLELERIWKTCRRPECPQWVESRH